MKLLVIPCHLKSTCGLIARSSDPQIPQGDEGLMGVAPMDYPILSRTNDAGAMRARSPNGHAALSNRAMSVMDPASRVGVRVDRAL